MINGHIGILNENIGNIRSCIYYMRYLPKDRLSTKHSKEGTSIHLEQVSFKYPDSKKSVLNDITLYIKQGDTIAIVGENGSGKTTLSKVLVGLFTPTKGKVLINGMDTMTINPKSLVENISGVFQNHLRYAFSLSDNVHISETTIKKDKDTITNKLRETGIHVEDTKYTYGLDTILSREFGGIDLSGGEWQKVAIARGIYKSSELIVLDEPTSAIDPIEEEKLYDVFRKAAKGKTAIIVTHRLAATRIADRILVMEHGKVIEDGTHEELLSLGGSYARMYHIQKSMYQYN